MVVLLRWELLRMLPHRFYFCFGDDDEPGEEPNSRAGALKTTTLAALGVATA